MEKLLHDQNFLCAYDPAWGNIQDVIASADNRSLGFVTISKHIESEHARERSLIERLVFNGKVLARWLYPDHVRYALSPDGGHIAYAPARVENGEFVGRDIMIDGEKKYECDFDVFSRLEWLSDTELIWEARNRNNPQEHGNLTQPEPIHYFRNGVDVTGALAFDTFLWGDGHSGIWVSDFTRNTSCEIRDDGTVREYPQAVTMLNRHKITPDHAEKPEQPRETREENKYRTAVIYRHTTGPVFNQIESGSGLRTYAFSADRAHLGYCGIRYATSAEIVEKYVGNWLTYADSTPSRILRNIVGWPLALLFNPYFGIGTAWMEGTKRWIPVHHPNEWHRGYRYARVCFFTPQNQLVVLAYDKTYAHVLIDNQEGPAFDEIYNIRYLKGEECICYIGQKDNTFYRVLVNTHTDTNP